METKKIMLHTAKLNNNCPECFGNEGLEIKFFQTKKDSFLFEKFSPTQHQLYCHNCKSDIFPVRWDEDIERVYDYHRKLANLHLHISKRKPMLWAFILILCILIVVGIYFTIA